MIDLSKYNAYVGVLACDEADARHLIQPNLIGDEPLVHVEPATEDCELPTYIFACVNEVQSDFEDWEMLHDHFDLPDLPNMPYEDMV